MTPLWINNISILYEKKYLLEIIPKKEYDMNRKLNCLIRIAIYYSVIVYILNKDVNIFLLPIIVSGITLLLSKKHKPLVENESIKRLMNNNGNSEELIQELEGYCRTPTQDNPFMNPTLVNTNDENSLESCSSYNNKGIQRDIENKFNKDLYRDINDIFGKNNSQRQFYTVPGKSNPNDQTTFAEWLYKTPPTCKEGNGLQCIANQYSSLGEGPWGGKSLPSN